MCCTCTIYVRAKTECGPAPGEAVWRKGVAASGVSWGLVPAGVSLKASLPAPLVADQTCRAPVASQDAMSGGLLPVASAMGSQHRAVIGLVWPVYCTPALYPLSAAV